MKKEEFEDYFKQMKKELRKTFYLAMKQYIYSRARFKSDDVNKEFNYMLQEHLIQYHN